MDDIVERLRIEGGLKGSYDPPSLQIEAADYIEELEDEIERLLDKVYIFLDTLTEIAINKDDQISAQIAIDVLGYDPDEDDDD